MTMSFTQLGVVDSCCCWCKSIVVASLVLPEVSEVLLTSLSVTYSSHRRPSWELWDGLNNHHVGSLEIKSFSLSILTLNFFPDHRCWVAWRHGRS